ncbi:MAG: hypothetical protein J6Y20_10650 [Lachnospiraceae bacterium]|nr:hypothetical protein [Lachnospiraceae bacterium]
MRALGVTKGSFFYDNDIQCVLCSEPLFFGELEPTVNILVMLIGLVLLFKNEISSIVSSAFDSIKLNSEAIVK